ncbi:MAG: type IV pili methyl-accepting chemotaxis transducer N-terminal domain-containing protein, partial [Pseudomonadota bacterium]
MPLRPRQPVRPSLSVQRRIVRGYSLALLLIAGAATATFFTLEAMIAQQSESAALINTSGRQRMLSQRIALQVTQLAIATDGLEKRSLRKAVTDDINTLLSSHEALIVASGGAEG